MRLEKDEKRECEIRIGSKFGELDIRPQVSFYYDQTPRVLLMDYCRCFIFWPVRYLGLQVGVYL